MRIIVYGIGRNGQEFLSDIKELKKDIEVVAVTDTYAYPKDVLDEIRGLYIEQVDMCCLEFDYVVVTPEKYLDEIKERLIELGIEKDKIKTREEIGEILGSFHCSLCQSTPFAWRCFGEDYDIFKRKKIIGGGWRRGRCPVCGCIDRERYVYYIIKNYTDLLSGKEHSVLHFAPETMLSKKIRMACGEKYISADIAPGRADVIADITNLQFTEEQFEYIICNHVMEHISAEERAFSEIKRCLKTGGSFIFTVPICWEYPTYEDKNVRTKIQRIECYGQEDHVRLYGNDIVDRVKQFGFGVTLYRACETVKKQDMNKFGFIEKDSVLLCEKLE